MLCLKACEPDHYGLSNEWSPPIPSGQDLDAVCSIGGAPSFCVVTKVGFVSEQSENFEDCIDGCHHSQELKHDSSFCS